MHKLHADEIALDEKLLRQLIEEQFPFFAELQLSPVNSSGSDHWLLRLGGQLLVRLPRRPSAAQQIPKVHDWLPRLSPALPLQVPSIVAAGKPCAAFPWPWSILSWIDGSPADPLTIACSHDAASRLALFVKALQEQDANSGPVAEVHNAYRGQALFTRDTSVRNSVCRILDADMRELALSVWDEALSAEPHVGAPKWLHGDLLPSNLLIADNRLVAVIDFGLLGVGDPACDLMAGWTLFNAEARKTFRAAIKPDDSAWSRGRGWALAFAAAAYAYYEPMGHPLAAIAARTMGEVLSSASSPCGDA